MPHLLLINLKLLNIQVETGISPHLVKYWDWILQNYTLLRWATHLSPIIGWICWMPLEYFSTNVKIARNFFCSLTPWCFIISYKTFSWAEFFRPSYSVQLQQGTFPVKEYWKTLIILLWCPYHLFFMERIPNNFKLTLSII